MAMCCVSVCTRVFKYLSDAGLGQKRKSQIEPLFLGTEKFVDCLTKITKIFKQTTINVWHYRIRIPAVIREPDQVVGDS
jgi:hypothetical protein